MLLKRDAPYIWVTWLTKLIVGRDSCVWSAWFRSNHRDYDRVPSSFDSMSWNIKHTNLLDAVDTQYQQRFERVQREHQNSFTYRGRSGATLAGKPDLIGFKGNEMRICDVKTGQQSDEHWAQMLLYMYFYPRCYPQLYKGMDVVGELIYPEAKQEVYMEEFDDAFKVKVMGLLQALSSTESSPKVPSQTECRYCHITATDCPERIEAGPENTQMEYGDF